MEAQVEAESDIEPVPALWLNVPARPGQLAGLRRALREWMAQAGLGEDDAATVQQAVDEATTNAVEHAYHGREPGLVRVMAWLGGGPSGRRQLIVQVSDTGHWRAPEKARDRGRGLPLMHASMDDVEVASGDGGTTVFMRRALGHRPS